MKEKTGLPLYLCCSIQIKKIKIIFLILFSQHRYTYCYNTFLFHQIQQIKRFIEFTERKKKFILFLFDWRELMNCWFVIAAPFIEEINFFKLRGGWL